MSRRIHRARSNRSVRDVLSREEQLELLAQPQHGPVRPGPGHPQLPQPPGYEVLPRQYCLGIQNLETSRISRNRLPERPNSIG